MSSTPFDGPWVLARPGASFAVVRQREGTLDVTGQERLNVPNLVWQRVRPKVSADLDEMLLQADGLRIDGRYPEAQALYEQILAADLSRAAAWNGLGHCQLNQGDFDESIASYRQAAELAPTQHKMVMDLGKALCMLGCFPEAREAFQQVLAMDPDNQEAQQQLAYLPPD